MTPLAWLRPAMAVLGGLALFGALILGQSGRTDWLLRFTLGWSVLVPYWWYLEYRLFLPAEPDARDRFLALQGFSRQVWLGGLAALALLLWWRVAAP